MTKVFVDGSAGTTGLRIGERLAARSDIELLAVSEELRKDPRERERLLNEADIAFLCLPDDAARESVALVNNGHTVVIDTSTAHRTASGWAYGFAELSPEHRAAIARGRRIAVPGCHASGFISLAYPLVASGLLPASALLSCTSLTGYSGGGKKMIAGYEAADRSPLLDAPRLYGLGQTHKHLPEMRAVCGLLHEPVFMPIVSDFYSGMAVSLPLCAQWLTAPVSPESLRELYAAHYAGARLVSVLSEAETEALGGFISAKEMSGLDSMKIIVTGNSERLTAVSLFDNLGKGASGAAVQCMNISLGLDETVSLAL